jgi:predicted DCC family thiol-disulfide oxidoreductase YuxK
MAVNEESPVASGAAPVGNDPSPAASDAGAAASHAGPAASHAGPAAAAPAKPGFWRRLGRRLRDTELTVDARSLGFGRIVLAVVLLVDLIRRVPDIRLFYSNEGLVPNHMMLWRPPTQWMFSFFFMLSLPDEVAVAFVICGLIYLALLVGWRTRVMQFLALIAVLSLHGRVTLMENGGDWMLGELAFWTAFMPLGRRFSLDAVRASLRRRRETTAAELADRAAMSPPPETNRIVTLAALGLVLEIANAYLFNALHKGGQTWRQGTAVHYVLHQDRMVTWFAVWMRPHMTLWLSRALSWGALATEGLLPLLLLVPFGRPWTRRAAVVAIIGLHVGFQCFINLGIFSWAMIGYTPFLLTAPDWDLFARIAARSRRRLTCYFDAGCGVCFQFARLAARLDRFGRVSFVSNAEAPADTSPELLAQTIVVVDENTGRRYTRADAVAQVARAFPVGWLWSLPFGVIGLHAVANAVYDWFAKRRETISRWLGLAACALPARAVPAPAPEPAPFPGGELLLAGAGVVAALERPVPTVEIVELPPSAVPGAPGASEPAATSPTVPAAPAGGAAVAADQPLRPPSPARRQLRRFVTLVREGAVLAMITTMVSETLFINAAVPKFLKHEQPLWIKRLVAYPRFIQAWSMFASDAPTTDLNTVVDAVTVDGRHVDPYSEAAGRYPDPGRRQIPVRMDNDSLFFNYSGRIPDNPAYHMAFQEWVLRYPERTGRPEDRIVRFDAYLVEDDSPPVGQLQPRNVRTRLFLSWPKH